MEEIKNEDIQDEVTEEAVEETQETSEAAEAVEGEVCEEAEAETAEEEECEEGEEPKRKGLFGKKKKDKKDQLIEELTDRVQRQMAEFDNFRKRSEKEKAVMYEVGAKSVIEKILPTIDNFERGFSVLTEEQKAEPFAAGMEKVYRQMLTTLEGIGVTPIEAVGQEFDPNLHNAVMHVEDEAIEESTVVQVFQKGYKLGNKVLRYAMVKVAN